MSCWETYLLDSHALLWWWVDPDRLSTAVRELLELSGAIADLPGLLQAVRRILTKHDVHRNQAQLVKSTIMERGEKGGFYAVEFTNLGLKKVPIDVDFIKRYPKLLGGGIWAITDLEYELPTDPKASPWQILSVNHEEFMAARAQFNTDEWMDVRMQSIGFNPEPFSRLGKMLPLIRLIPFCARCQLRKRARLSNCRRAGRALAASI